MSTVHEELSCPKCLTHRGGDPAGMKCPTPGCDGVIQVMPSYASLVDVLPEPMTCGRRYDGDEQGADRWHKFKAIDNRVCSHCGSLHPDDLFRLVKQAAETPEDVSYDDAVTIEQSDKPYKIYIRQPGVRNANEGGIKFYTQHLPKDAQGEIAVSDERNREYHEARLVSRKRFDKILAERVAQQAAE